MEQHYDLEGSPITRVLIVDDRAMVRKSLQMFLNTEPSIRIIGEAEDVQSAIHQAENLQPDVALLDLMMPPGNGVEAIAKIKSRFPNIKIIALTMAQDESSIITALAAGADGYLLKEIDGEQLLQAIWAVRQGVMALNQPAPFCVFKDKDTNLRGWSESNR